MTPEQQKQIEDEAKQYAQIKTGELMGYTHADKYVAYMAGRLISAERLEQLEAEVARLTGLLKEAHNYGLSDGYSMGAWGGKMNFNDSWLNFKQQNNIQ